MTTVGEHISLYITKLVVFVVYLCFMYYALTSPWRVDKWFRSNSGWKTLIRTTVLRVASGVMVKQSSDVTAQMCYTTNDYIDDQGKWIVKHLATGVVMATYVILVQTIEHMHSEVEKLREAESTRISVRERGQEKQS